MGYNKRKKQSIALKRISDKTGIGYHAFREKNLTDDEKEKVKSVLEEDISLLLCERYKLCKASDTDYNARTDSITHNM
jgi:hypothetical protein